MPQTNHGSIEFLRFPDPQHPGDNTHLIKKWLRDSWARRKIVSLASALAGKSEFFGAKTGYHLLSSSDYVSLDAALTAVFPSTNGANAVIHSANLSGSFTGSPVNVNQAHVFGWLNNTANYGWFVFMSYSGAYFGKRAGSTTTTWSAM